MSALSQKDMARLMRDITEEEVVQIRKAVVRLAIGNPGEYKSNKGEWVGRVEPNVPVLITMWNYLAGKAAVVEPEPQSADPFAELKAGEKIPTPQELAEEFQKQYSKLSSPPPPDEDFIEEESE
jgi:hypothetical protein